jgi:integrase
VPNFSAVADEYLKRLETMDLKRQLTRKRESSSVDCLKCFFGTRPVTKLTMSDAAGYAEWRKSHPMRKGWSTVSGRAIDLDIIALRHILEYALTKKYVARNPIGKWKKMAAKPKKVRLVPNEELQKMLETARSGIVQGRQFADYLRLLAASGGREQEALRLRWSVNVDWTGRRLGFGQDGLSKFGKERWMPFNPKLESLLKEMHERRDLEVDWLFPSPRLAGGPAHPVTSYKKALISLKKQCGTQDGFGFHHLRHYFISWCVMSKVDLVTIADWVGHEDINLIARIYTQITNEHSARQAASVSFEPPSQSVPAPAPATSAAAPQQPSPEVA